MRLSKEMDGVLGGRVRECERGREREREKLNPVNALDHD
jgi:hypothetical protein